MSRTRSVSSSRCNARRASGIAPSMSPGLRADHARVPVGRCAGHRRARAARTRRSHGRTISVASWIRPSTCRAAARVTDSRMLSSVASSPAGTVSIAARATVIARSSWPRSRQIRHSAVAALSRVGWSGSSSTIRWYASAAAGDRPGRRGRRPRTRRARRTPPGHAAEVRRCRGPPEPWSRRCPPRRRPGTARRGRAEARAAARPPSPHRSGGTRVRHRAARRAARSSSALGRRSPRSIRDRNAADASASPRSGWVSPAATRAALMRAPRSAEATSVSARASSGVMRPMLPTGSGSEAVSGKFTCQPGVLA